MKDGLKVFDADSHVRYPADMWQRFLEPRFKDRVGRHQPFPDFEVYNPTTVDGVHVHHDKYISGSPRLSKIIKWTREDLLKKYGALMTEGFTGPLVNKALEAEGVDLAVIYGPEYDMWYEGIDPELQAGFARAYNRWGQEMNESSGRRIHVSAPVPLTDVKLAVQEIRYAYEHLGARCFWSRPNPCNGRNLGDPYYDPVWELLQDLDCAFGTHEFMGRKGDSYGANRFEGFIEWHCVVHPFEAMSAIVSMICHGVYERFPKLRVAYMEAGCGWLPSWLHRIDEHLEMAGGEFPQLTMNATGYFRRNCWISAECEDPFVADVIAALGDDHIVYETDFPHPDSKFPRATEHFLSLAPDRISRDSKRKILWDNAIDLYRFPQAAYPQGLVPESSAVRPHADATS